MKMFISVTGLTKITVLNDNNVTVFDKSVPMSKVKDVLDKMPVEFSEQDVTQVFLNGPTKVVPKLLQDLRPKYSKATYCVNGGSI